MRLRPGEVLGGTYRLDAPLARGGMGEVWRAFDLARGGPVAVKFVLGLDPELLLRFEREARLAARVDRAAGVVRVHALGRHGELPYCVMELVEGRDLAAVLAEGPPPPEQLARWTAQLARTLAACHAAGVLHRDVKPANVLIAPDGTPKLADFGLARDPQAQALTQTGDLIGSPAYMAPEQLAGGPGALDPQVDVYGLGALLYHGLTGRPPFVGTVLDVLRALEREAPPRPSALRPGLPAALEAICLRALARDRQQRYPSAAALADDLERFLAGAPARATARPRRAAAALAAVVLGLGAAAFGVGRFGGQPRSGEAPAALVELEAWSERTLVPWALGLGTAPPPPADELAAWIARLRAARATPGSSTPGDGEDLAPALAAALERLEAHQALLAADAGGEPPRRASGPTAAAAAAAYALAQGDAADATAALARVGPAPPPEAAAARRAAWRRLLALRPTLDTAQAFLLELSTLEPGAEREVALEDASLALAAGYEALARGLEGSEPQGWRLALEHAREALGADGAASVRAAKARGLAAAAPAWEQALAQVSPGEPLAARSRLAALGGLLGAEPAIDPPPALEAALARAFAPVSELEPRLALDQACFEYLGWGPPLPPALALRLEGELRSGAPMGEWTEALALAAVRHGLATGEDGRDYLLEIARRLEAHRLPLRERHPHSRGALLLDATRRYRRDPRRGQNDGEPDPALIPDLRRVCEDPRLQRDVAPWYLARACLFLARLLQGEAELAGEGIAPAAAAEIVALAERARTLAPTSLALLGESLERSRPALTLAARLEVVARLERRYQQGSALGERLAPRQRRAFLSYLALTGALLELERRDVEAARRRAQAALRAQGPPLEDDPPELAAQRVKLIEALWRAGQHEEAERLVVAEERAGGYRNWRFAREAARVARARGDLAEARARLRRGLEYSDSSELGKLLREYEGPSPREERP